MTEQDLSNLLEQLTKAPENEWIEFKLNYHSDEEIGERISALANGACLNNQPIPCILLSRQCSKIFTTIFLGKLLSFLKTFPRQVG